MASIWQQAPDGTWQQARSLEGAIEQRARRGDIHVKALKGERGAALLISDEQEAWVSGRPALGGLVVLSHRDEIVIAGQRAYYSVESQPVLAPFALREGARRPKCPVCRMLVEDGQASVTCPGCGRVYHESDAAEGNAEKHCFTYREQCLCGHPTGLSGEPQWRPEAAEE